jgi:hypothetical protein
MPVGASPLARSPAHCRDYLHVAPSSMMIIPSGHLGMENTHDMLPSNKALLKAYSLFLRLGPQR